MIEEQKLYELAECNPFAKEIGMEILELREGYAKGRIRLEQKCTNVYGGMHGGCAYTLADTLAGIAAASYGYYVTTVNGTMNYLLPIQNTEYVGCEAQVVRQGGRVGVYDVRITGDEGTLFSTGCFTYYRLEKKIC